MEWQDEGILLAVRRHGETSVIASVLTREHGRHAGLIKGGAGKAARGALQPGNRLQLAWKARLEEHLGHFSWELAAAHGTAWLHDASRLAGLTAACAMAEITLPEREPQPAVYEGLVVLLTGLAEEDWAVLYLRWEMGLLAELGYGREQFRAPAPASVLDGLRLTGYFLERHLLAPRGKGLPAARVRLVERLGGGTARQP